MLHILTMQVILGGCTHVGLAQNDFFLYFVLQILQKLVNDTEWQIPLVLITTTDWKLQFLQKRHNGNFNWIEPDSKP